MAKVLVVATSRKTRGGITSVIKAHEKGGQWDKYHCRWIETHRDGGFLRKLLYVLCAFTQYLCLLPKNDIVHIHIGEAPSALRKIAFMAYARLWKKKTIVHFHSFSPDTTIKGRYNFLYHYLFTRADKVIVLSEYWKNEVTSFVPGADIEILYNPCTTEVTIKDDVIKESYIFYAGTISQRKGYADMIKAFSLIAEKHPDWKIVFAGNGEIEQGQKLAEHCNVQGQTKWLGWVNGEAKDLAFRKASVFCLPSYAEGFSMAVLDAWAYGLPVITTPVGGIPDVANDGENMLLFQPGDCRKLSQCMQLMIENDELRNSISSESKKLASTKFNINTINRQLADIYCRLVDNK